MLGVKTKTAAEVLDFDVELHRWIDESDSIVDAEATVATVGGVTVSSVQIFNDRALVRVWLSGGTEGETYTINVLVTTEGGRIKEECFEIRVVSCRR